MLPLTPTELAIIITTTKPELHTGKDTTQGGLILGQWGRKMGQLPWKSVWQRWPNFNLQLPYDLVTPPGGIDRLKGWGEPKIIFHCKCLTKVLPTDAHECHQEETAGMYKD